MSTTSPPRRPHFTAVLREEETVTPLERFFDHRNLHTLNRQRLVCAVVALALIPAAVEIPGLATLAVLAALLIGLVAYETIRFAELRERIRHGLDQPGGAA